MGFGIEVMLAIARRVAALPGAEGRVSAFGAGTLLLATASLFVLTLPASRLRLAGVPLAGVALVLAVSAPRPDVLVEGEGRVVAVRGGDGRLSILDARRSRIAAENWLAADGDGRKVTAELAAGFACDRSRCAARLGDGSAVVVVRAPDAWAAACSEAALVVSRLDPVGPCAAAVVDRRLLATTGAISLRRIEGKWIAEAARSPIADRPWFGRRAPPDAAALLRFESGGQALPRTSEDATPFDADDPSDDAEAANEAN
jgi:competence protein ComEC